MEDVVMKEEEEEEPTDEETGDKAERKVGGAIADLAVSFWWWS